jgi:hypothetical protein
MPKKVLSSFTALILAHFLFVSLAFGVPIRRYRPPAGPTMPSALNYSRPDFSTLPDSYRNLVVPQQRLDRDLYDLSRTQQADFRAVEKEIGQTRSPAAPTGSGGGFMNYSHYYNLKGQQGGGSQRSR